MQVRVTSNIKSENRHGVIYIVSGLKKKCTERVNIKFAHEKEYEKSESCIVRMNYRSVYVSCIQYVG